MLKIMKAIAAVLAVSALMAGSAFAGDKLVVRNDGNTANVFRVDGTSGLTEVGAWTGAPPTVTGYLFNVAGDFFAGNVGANVGRFRLASNNNAGFIYWNTFWNGTASNLSDTTKPAYAVRIDGQNDKFQIRRGAPTTGAVTFTDLFVVTGAGNVGIGTGSNAVTSKLQVVDLPVYESNDLAKSGGLTAGAFYTDGAGNVKVVY